MATKKKTAKKTPKKTSRGARRKTRRRRARQPWLKPALLGLALVLGLGTLWLLWPFWQLAGQFADRPVVQPSRLYAAPKVLEVGVAGSAVALRRELEEAGYASSGSRPPAPGQFQATGDGLLVHVRRTPTTEGWREAGLARVRYAVGAVSRLSWRDSELARLELEAPRVASYYGPQRRERRPMALEDLPEYLTEAVLAAEDAKFFEHQGVSARGILRALWVNLRAGEVRQGGSTLTQQLVKNMFLTHERRFSRKVREAILALLVDWRYSKPAILGAYLNEIYWGQRDGINIMGVGAASEAYFGKSASRLTLCEAALLAGMIQSPGSYDPGRHPEAARTRRDWVLGRMGGQGRLDPQQVAAAQEAPLCYRGRPPVRTVEAGYFRQAVARDVAERFGVRQLADSGHTILTTLSVEDQRTAEEAVQWGVEALEEGWEKGRDRQGPLQAALVSIEPGSGAVTAYVGGRDYATSQFDRAGQAERQAGSAFKPVVYATAIERGVALPASQLLDEELAVEVRGAGVWEPQNDDRRYRGRVSARQALELSLNVPTARLALDTGISEIGEMASALGIDRRLPTVPSMALGALEVTPLELATVYATLAAGGVRREPFMVRGVLAPDGSVVAGRQPADARRVLSSETAYLVTAMLEGVFDRGTARVVRQWGMVDRLAGKTGTTNDRRDSWFAGYSPSRAALVWVGYDDNSPTRLSGSRAALPIWNRFFWRVRPREGYRAMQPPPGVTSVTIDPLSGELATERCPELVIEYFPRDRLPGYLCHLHASRYELRAQGREELIGPRRNRFRRWLDRVFKEDRDERRPPDG